MSSEDSLAAFDKSGTAAAAQEAELVAALEERVLGDDLKLLMSNASGRRWMWWLLSECRVFHSSFSTSALDMARREGRREIGLLLMGKLNTLCPERYEEMRKEQVNGGRKRNRRSNEQQRDGDGE